MDIRVIEKVYRRYAKSYDFYFGALFQPGRKAVVERMHCRPGERILEVGVGTGLSLPLYPPGAQVTGIDISGEMLARARARPARDGLKQVVALLRMDAERMYFRDNSFDKVVAMYVVSVVPSPARLVAEMRRVCRPGGELYIVNHFQHANPLVSGAERLLAPLSRLLGFHSDFPLQNFLHETGLEVSERIPVNVLGYWTLLRARNGKAPAASAAPAHAASRMRAV
jgi:phosphatidylethanolamine/phosphatidyl-N-methylethanolamine N-methyltransferase